MPGVDRQAGMDFIESFMTDTCIVTRDTQQVLDDVLNLSTMVLERPVNDDHVVYRGKCVVKKPRADTAKPVIVAGQETSLHNYRILLPLSAVNVRLGDMILLVATKDLFMKEKVFRVMDVEGGTHATYRGFFVTDLAHTLPVEG